MSTQTQSLAKRDTLEGILARPAIADRFKQVLGQRAPQFMSSIISLGRGMPDVEPKSIVASCMQAATLDLPIEKNLGFAWVIPYKSGGTKYAQFQMGFKGYVQLALRTGRYERMNACPINKEAYKGRDSVGEPVIDWDALDETKEIVGYAFGFKLVSGFTKVVYWTKAKVVAHAQRYSRAYRNRDADSVWEKEFDKMALKTVIGNTLSDWGILSVEWQMARRLDQGIVKDIDAEVEFLDNDPPPPDNEVVHPTATGHQQATTPSKAPQAPSKGAESPSKAADAAKAPAEPAKSAASKPGDDDLPMEGATPLAKKEAAAEAPGASVTHPEPVKATNTPSEGQTQALPVEATQGDGKSEAAAPPETPDPALGPEAGDTDSVASVKLLAQKSGTNFFQLRTFLLAKHLMRPDQHKLNELATTKLDGITRNFPKWLPDIIKLPRSA